MLSLPEHDCLATDNYWLAKKYKQNLDFNSDL